MNNKTDTISIKIPSELNKLLDKIAIREDRSKSSIIRKAIQEYVEDIEDTMIGLKALERFEKGDKKTYSFEEVNKKLGL